MVTIPKKPPVGVADAKKSAAMDYRKRGLPFIPIMRNKTVEAAWKSWQTRDFPEDDMIASLEEDGTRNIAIVMNRTRFIDVECDTEEAEAALQKLFDGDIPATPTYTSHRGKHRWFLRPDDVLDTNVHKIDGIEFGGLSKTKGKLAIAPPSIHQSGHRYAWLPGLSLDDLEPAELPGHVADLLRRPASKAPSSQPNASAEKIAKGDRNKELFKKACLLREVAPPEIVEALLLDLNKRLCDPPLEPAEVKKIAKNASSREGREQSFVAQFLSEVELWNDGDNPFMTLTLNEHRENWRIGKRVGPFAQLLSKRFYDATGEVLGGNGLADLAQLISAKAKFEGPKHQTFLRVGEHEGNLYLDLCDEPWRSVEIGPDGWQVLSDPPPIKFRRANAMRPLPVPVRSKKSLRELLRPFLNVKDTQWPLVAAWLAAALRPTGPYAILKVLGEQGSAKSTTARLLRSCVDPNKSNIRGEPKSTDDLVIAANNGAIVCLDNLSTFSSSLSDGVCRLSTGGGISKRKLYSDDDEVIIEVCRPVILTSIEDVATRSDLLERSLIIELPSITEEDRQTERELWRRFEAALPEILGALLDVVSKGLRKLPEIEADPPRSLGRMADFEVWGLAVEGGLGLEPGTFAAAYLANRQSANQIALDSNPIIEPLLKCLQKQKLNGDGRHELEMSPTELLGKLKFHAPADPERMPGWPKGAKVLSEILQRLTPNLRFAGIKLEHFIKGSGNDKSRCWRISMPEKKAEPAKSKQQPPPAKLSDRLNGYRFGGTNGTNGTQVGGQSFSATANGKVGHHA